MPLDQTSVNAAIVDIVQHIDAPIIRKLDLIEEYKNLVEYLCRQWELDTEAQLLEYMEHNKIQFWSPLPLESSAGYENFVIYLQLPDHQRTIKNVTRVTKAAKSNMSVLDVTPSSISRAQRLFWEVRADLYDKAMLNELVASLGDNQLQRVAAMRNRSLTIATVTSDIAIEMLVKSAEGIRNLDPETLSPNQLVNIVATASRIAKDSNQLAEQALLLNELIEVVQDLEAMDEETLRFVEAEVLDDGEN